MVTLPTVCAFHSYKGGQGRSTALVNCAAALQWLGRRVLLIDTDLNAPWLASILHAQGAATGPGFTETLAELWSSELGRLPRSFDTASWFSDDGCITTLTSDGQVMLLAAGSIGHTTQDQAMHWEFASHMLPRLASDKWRLTYSLHRVVALAIEALRPDVVLVDLPSGNSAVSRALSATAADVLLQFSASSPDSWRVTQAFGAEVRRDRRLLAQEPAAADLALYDARLSDTLRTVLVGARVPHYQQDEPGLGFHNVRNPRPPANVEVPADPRLEVRPQVIPFRSADAELGGRDPAVEAFGRLLAACDLAPFEEFADLPWRLEGSQPRLFYLEQPGPMGNPGDAGEPNISLRVASLRKMIESILDEPLANDPQLEYRGDDDEGADAMLFRAGAKAGTSFGEDLSSATEGESFQARVDRWCQFDSSVGFGRLEQSGVDGVESGYVSVESSFTAYGATAESRDLCPLLGGYIASVIRVLLQDFGPSDVLRISHALEDCQRTSDVRECKFHYEVLRSIQASQEDAGNV